MTREEMLDAIHYEIGPEQAVSQAAEEASELSAALSKLRRKMDGVNPTPKSITDCMQAVAEEIADLKNALMAAGIYYADGDDEYGVRRMAEEKTKRWYRRVFGRDAE